jgi:hypothetical protein
MAKRTTVADRLVATLEAKQAEIRANAARDVAAIQISIDALLAQPKRARKAAKKPAALPLPGV